MNPVNLAPFQFLLDHLQHVGWGAILVLVWKVSRFITRKEKEWDTVVVMTTNHMPHVLMSMDTSLRIMSKRDPAKPNEFEA